MLIHRFWMGPPRPDAVWVREALGHTQGCPVQEWTPENLPADARWVLHHADVRDVSNRLRYQLLATYGGLWVDHDLIPLRRFPTDAPWTASIGSYREGAALYFPEPGHPMAVRLATASQLVRTVRGDPATATGAGMLRRIGDFYPEVRLEPRVLPLDALGRPTAGARDPLAFHLWESSRPA